MFLFVGHIYLRYKKTGSVLFMCLAFLCQSCDITDTMYKNFNKDQTIKVYNNCKTKLINDLNQRQTIIYANIDLVNLFVTKLQYEINKKHVYNSNYLVNIADSLYLNYLYDANITPTFIYDTTYYTEELLKDNFMLALKALKEASWCDEISFKDFYEYIQPYKINNEIVDNWRDSLYKYNKSLISNNTRYLNMDSLYAYHINNTYFNLRSNIVLRKYYPSNENFSWINISKEGDCNARCNYVIYFLRAAGAPATYDYLPNWGNRPHAEHSYVGLANKTKQLNKLLKNNNDPNNLVDNLNSTMPIKYNYIFNDNELPPGIYVQYEKTIPKVYRQTWSDQSEMKEIIASVPNNEVYKQLLKNNMTDVTNQYLEVSKIKISRKLNQNVELAYLATFDIKGWIPVAFAKFNMFGVAEFDNIGRNVLYIPVRVIDEKVEPIDSPFILDSNGRKNTLFCDHEKRINMKLLRKFPFFSYTASHMIGFKGCRIEGSNDYHFKNSKLLHEIDYYPYYMQQIEFESPDTFQYVHLIAPEGQAIRIAEFECYEDSCGKIKKIEDSNFKNNSLRGNFKNAFDGDLNSYLVGRWVRMDFGIPKAIKRIRFCPRNDTNCIIPGNVYELFYWDNNQWLSAGKKVANDFYIQFSNVPSGTIYWVKNHNGGTEERIFTYENGRQIWW